MSRLTDEQYHEYVRLLAAWVEADRAAKEGATPDPEAAERARRAYSDLMLFRSKHQLEAQPAERR